MDLKEYFVKKRTEKLPEYRKMMIYDSFMDKIEHKSMFFRFSFYSKIAVYSMALLFLMYSLFIDFPITSVEKDWIISFKNGKIVHASYIGKVVETEWDFTIYHNNEVVNRSDIYDNDVLVLGEDATIAFSINSWVNSYIIWPAQLQISRFHDENDKEKYIFYMEGTYLNVRSNTKDDILLIKSDNLELEPEIGFVDVTISVKEGESLIENKWTNLLVKKDVDNKKKMINLAQNENLIVLSESKINTIKTIFDSKNTHYQMDNKWDIKLIANMKQINELNSLLSRENIKDSVDDLVLGYLKNDNNMYDNGVYDMVYIISSVYKKFDIVLDSELLKTKVKNWNLDVQDIQLLIDQLISKLNGNNILPAMHIEKLKTILWWMVVINSSDIKCYNCKTLQDVADRLKLDEDYKKRLMNF